MNLDLEERLMAERVRYERIAKPDKVRLLGRWSREYPELMNAARHQEPDPFVFEGKNAEMAYLEAPLCDFYLLPDDHSGMPSYACSSSKPPVLTDLVTDMFTRCDELVVVEVDFRWSAVFVNHGPSPPGCYFSRSDRRLGFTT